MATEYILAPNARWQGRNETGQPIENGKLYTYLNQTVQPKATYQDYQGLQPNTNPVILDGKGEANIYWATDDLYTIKLFTEDDEEVYTQDNYPVVGTNTTNIVSESESNIARNNQFSYWYYGTSFSPVVGVGSVANQDYICDDWYYSRVDTTYTVNVTRQTFSPDQDAVPGNPIYFFRYAAATAPASETNSRLYQTYQSVQTLANSRITIAFRGKSPDAKSVKVYLVQDFGGGGSADVETLVMDEALTSEWQQKTGSITIPSMVGKTVGTSSELRLEFRFPNDSTATIDLCNIQFQVGATLSTNFPFQTQETQYQELVNRLQDALPSTGDVKPTFKTAVDPGWLLCNDTTIGNTSSGATTTGLYTKALYTLLWNNVANNYAPIYDSAGALTTRGASAEADYNALKRILLTRMLGRVIASAGTGAVPQTVTNVDTGTDTLTIGYASDLIYYATPVTFSSTATLPAPLNNATTYYADITAATTFQVYPTIADAINGTNLIDLTTAGTGTITVSVNYSAYTLAQPAGEILHGLLLTESPAHNHTGSTINYNNVGGVGGTPVAALANNTIIGTTTGMNTIASAGSSTKHNVMQPTVFLNYMIKL